MYGFNKFLNSDQCSNTESSAFNQLLLLAGLSAAVYTFARVHKASQQLKYDSYPVRLFAGCIILLTQMFHMRAGQLKLVIEEPIIVAVGPHKAGPDGAFLASIMEGTPPRFYATTAFNKWPGVATFLKLAKTIPVVDKAKKTDGHSANAVTEVVASQALKNGDCVAFFPQGNFSRIGQEPHRVYDGAAKLAVANNIAIKVVRFDGYWSIENPFIPVFIRNNTEYRAFLTWFHMNNIRPTLCTVIDFHLKPEPEHLSDEEKEKIKVEKIFEINAILYAYYRHTRELTQKEIDVITNKEIPEGLHRDIWRKKLELDKNKKDRPILESEMSKLEESTSLAMRNR